MLHEQINNILLHFNNFLTHVLYHPLESFNLLFLVFDSHPLLYGIELFNYYERFRLIFKNIEVSSCSIPSISL
jgi:hypothetical protein